MTVQELVRQAERAGVRLSVVNGELKAAFPKHARSLVSQIQAAAAEVAAVVTNTCSWCGVHNADGGADVVGSQWCARCRDLEQRAQAHDLPSLLIVDETRAAWEGAMYTIGAALGYPEVKYTPSLGVARGEAHWLRFAKRAPIEDLAAVHRRLLVMIADLPQPGAGLAVAE